MRNEERSWPYILAKLGKNVLDLVVAKLPIGSLRRGILQR